MPSVVLCFHAHLPLRLKKYSFFDIGHSQDYFDEEESRQVLERTAKDCYLPVNAALLKLIRRKRGLIRVSCSISGMLLEQLEKGQKAVLTSFRRLGDTGSVEFSGEPYHHSLASLFSEDEFREQIALQRRKVRTLFGLVPRSFRNTGLIYGNDVARIAESMGFRVFLAAGAGRLADDDTTALYRPEGCRRLKVLLRHDRLSGDIASRNAGAAMSKQSGGADAFVIKLAEDYRGQEIVNLFLDYESFGKPDCSETGIFDFLEAFTVALLKQRNWRFLTPSGAAAEHEPARNLDLPGHVSEADGSAWLGNHMQKDAARTLFAMEARVREAKNRKRIGVWRSLQASEHFGYMGKTDLSDGALRCAFNPFATPYDAYISYMNVLKDFSGRLACKTGVRA
jgi:alpha-amylase